MHDVHISPDHDAIIRIYAEEVMTAFQNHMREAERMAEEACHLLSAVDVEQNPDLVRWAATYGLGISTAAKISRDGQARLQRFTRQVPARMTVPVEAPAVTTNAEVVNATRAAPVYKPARRPLPAAVKPSGYAGGGIVRTAGAGSEDHLWSRFPARRAGA